MKLSARMHPRPRLFLFTAILPTLACVLLASSCISPSESQSSSQTNWYRKCNSDLECNGLECICGACTTLCSDEAECRDDGSLCLTVTDGRATNFCEGVTLAQAVCVQRCDEETPCLEGTVCKENVCQVLPTPDATVTLDLTKRHQTLIGFGASLAYAERNIVGRDDEAALYDALFSELGVDTIRLTNHFTPGREEPLDMTAQIIEAATDRLGREPALLMTSGSPPAELKANGTRLCDGDEGRCTLAQLEDGSFDYEGFAQYWRASLESYAAVGIEPDFVSIQNNPNWSPPEGNAADACRFLPEEGTTTISDEEVRLAGYLEAAEAVNAALDGLASIPALFGPETTSLNAVPRYEPVFATGLLSAVAIHLYGMSIENPRTDELNAVRALGDYYDIPVIQSEMMAQGLETAAFIHHATVEANATSYLQNDFISQAGAPDPNENALIQLEETSGFIRQSPYYALQHFARHTEPGWIRVSASVDRAGLLASAWIAPDETGLTVILVNPSTTSLRTQIDRSTFTSGFAESSVSQTIFNADLEHQELGALDEHGFIDIPGQSAVTVSLTSP